MARLAAIWSTELEPVEHGLIAALADLVNADFKRHCRIAGIQRYKLVIHVDEASLVYPMRIRWAGPLQRMLASGFHRPTINGLWFQFGRGGTCISREARGTTRPPMASEQARWH